MENVTATAFTKSHIPDIRLPAGFLDIAMVGALIELGEAINRSHYSKQTPPEIAAEETATRIRFQKFQTWVAVRFFAKIGQESVSVEYVFRRYLLELASTIHSYIRDRPGCNNFAPKCTDAAFKDVVEQQLRKSYPELIPKFEALLQNPKTSFLWTGPQFQIFVRPRTSPSVITHDLNDLPSDPIYLALTSQEQDVDMQDVEHGDEEAEGEEGEGEGDGPEEEEAEEEEEEEEEGTDGDDEGGAASTSHRTKRAQPRPSAGQSGVAQGAPTARGGRGAPTIRGGQGAPTIRGGRGAPTARGRRGVPMAGGGRGAPTARAPVSRSVLVPQSAARSRIVSVQGQGGDEGGMEVDVPAREMPSPPRFRIGSEHPCELTTVDFSRFLTTALAPTPVATTSQQSSSRKRRRKQ